MEGTVDLKAFIASCNKCQRSDGTLSTDHYLYFCNELIRLCSAIGLSPALYCAKDAIKTLEVRRVMGVSNHYNTLGQMLTYEAENGLAKSGDKLQSGTKACLDLHRTINFIVEYFKAIKRCEDEGLKFKFKLRSEIYEDTLAPHQNSQTQLLVKFALSQAPGKKKIEEQLCKSCTTDTDNVLNTILLSIVPLHNKVSDTIKQIFLQFY